MRTGQALRPCEFELRFRVFSLMISTYKSVDGISSFVPAGPTMCLPECIQQVSDVDARLGLQVADFGDGQSVGQQDYSLFSFRRPRLLAQADDPPGSLSPPGRREGQNLALGAPFQMAVSAKTKMFKRCNAAKSEILLLGHGLGPGRPAMIET
ncbi:unnamed protein product [Prorocentrum cordatum]|uniref:Uncharacterized protein n=1 Tax=Prorocentrum cordatum TaxID=2364126 RepID=A0ABN9XMA4_9DINO|nr:unnamed protein product [Polarella glacialis]